MKVRELIEQLKTFDDDSEVHFSYNYGDHWRTMVAPKVHAIEEMFVKHSAYHNMPMIVTKTATGDEDMVVVLR